jgi:predicted dehydrogenase
MASTSEPWRPFADAPEGAPVRVPDSSAHLLEFASGATGVIHTSFVSRGIDGVAGIAGSGRSEPRVEVTGSRGRIVTVAGQRLQGISGGQGPLAELEVTHGPMPYEELVRGITEGAPVRTSFREGWKAAEIADAAFLSLAERRWVEIEETG